MDDFQRFVQTITESERILENTFGPLENRQQQLLCEVVEDLDTKDLKVDVENGIVVLKEEPAIVLDEYLQEEQNSDCDEYIDDEDDGQTDDSDQEYSEKSPKTRSSKKIVTRIEEDDQISDFYKLDCDLCGQKFQKFLSLNRHYKIKHKVRGYVTCCEKKFNRRFKIIQHLQYHRDPKTFRCKVCKKILQSTRALKSHMDIHAPPEAKVFQCDKCPKKFLRAWKLEKHVLFHSGEKSHICATCDKAFMTLPLLQNHVRNVHENKYVRICDICAKVYRNQDCFNRHQLEHAGIRPEKVECKICNKFYSTKYKLTQHVKIHHDDPNSCYKCDLCDKISPNQRALKNHIAYVHTNDRKHQCNFCDKSFKRPKELKVGKFAFFTYLVLP